MFVWSASPEAGRQEEALREEDDPGLARLAKPGQLTCHERPRRDHNLRTFQEGVFVSLLVIL